MASVLVLLASVLFGTTGVTQALAFPDANPVLVGALRIAAGGVPLGIIAVPGALRDKHAGGRLRAQPALLVLAGAAGIVAYQPAFFSGVRDNGVAVGTLLALGSAPVFTGLLAWATSGARPSRRWAICTAVAVAGIALLSGLVDKGAVAIDPLGALLSLLAGCAYAVYTLAVKALLNRGWATLQTIGAVFGAAGAGGVVELAIGDPRFVAAASFPGTLWLGGATIVLAYLLFARGLRKLPASTVATITLAEPVVAAMLGVLALNERLTPPAIVGVVLLIIALALLSARVSHRRAAATEAPVPE